MKLLDKLARIRAEERAKLQDELDAILERLRVLYESGEGDDEVKMLEQRRAEIVEAI